mmetsp:Transcript_27628/g.44514  ORF Transcript_27628/g.44514 Transcript_27628/m.44514 type:complete len:413 (-) Transcript_27628:161-1399(-)
MQIAVVERFEEPCHENGSSHGDGRIFRFAYPQAEYVELAQKAKPGWMELQDFYGEDLLLGKGGLDIGYEYGTRIQSVISTLKDLNVPFEVLGPSQMEARFPQFSLRKNEIAVYQEDAAAARATPTINAVWQYLKMLNKKKGDDIVKIFQGQNLVEVSGIGNVKGGDLSLELNGRDDATTTTTTTTTIKAKSIVLAMGSWIMPFLSKLGLEVPLIGTEERVCYFKPKSQAIDHTYRSMPVFIPHFDHNIVTELMEAGIKHETANDWGFYGLPEIEVPGVKLSAHHTGVSFTDPELRPSRVDPELSDRRKDEIVAACAHLISHLFPHLNLGPHKTQTCLYTSSEDHDFVIDTHPLDSRVVLAAGFSGHGFKFGPSLGDLIANLAIESTSTALNPAHARFSLKRFPNFGLATPPG